MFKSEILVRHHVSESCLQNLNRCGERPRTVDRYRLWLRRLWLRDVSAQMTNDPRLPHMTLADPKILMAVVTWIVYGVLLASRRWAGLTARRAAWLSAVGFAIVLLNFLPVAYFFARSHNFA